MTSFPNLYTFFFTYFDPILALIGGYIDIFHPSKTLSSMVPGNPIAHPAHIFIFQRRGGAMMSISFLSAVLLRYSTDLGVWKCLQASTLIVDVATAYSVLDGLRIQGRLGWGGVRKIELGALALVGFSGCLRAAFIAGVGLGGRRGPVKRL